MDQFAWPRGLATAEVLWAGGAAIGQGQSTGNSSREILVRWEVFETFYKRARLQYPILQGLGVRVGHAFPPGWSVDGEPPSRDAVNTAIPGSCIETTLPAHGWHHAEFAADGQAETYFQSARAVQAGDTVELRFGPNALKGCVVVRARSGRFERNSLHSGILELLLAPTGTVKNGDSGTGTRKYSDQVSTICIKIIYLTKIKPALLSIFSVVRSVNVGTGGER